MNRPCLAALVLAITTPAARAGDSLFEAAGFDPRAAADKEAELYDLLVDQHTPYGQPWAVVYRTANGFHLRDHCSCDPTDSESGLPYCGDMDQSDVLDTVADYGRDGDGAVFTGHMLAMQAYKLAVMQDAQTAFDFSRTLETIEDMAGLHPTPGLFARSFVPPGATFELDPGEGEIVTVTAPGSPYLGYRYRRGDMTRDQYSGLMLGLYTAYKVVDIDETRARIRNLVVEFVDALIANDYKLHDTVQDVSFDPGLISYDRANMALAYLRLAFEVSGESRFLTEFDDRYDDWIGMAQGLNRNISKTDAATCFYKDNYYQFTIVAPAVYMGAVLTDGSAKQTSFETIVDELYNGYSPIGYGGMKGEKNALFDLFYALGRHDGWYYYWLPTSYDPLDRDALVSALRQLALYPAGPRRRVEQTNPDIAETNRLACFGDKWFMSTEALDIDHRPAEFYQWEATPHVKESRCVQPWVQYPGLDYLEAYWMARYYGFGLQPRADITLESVSAGKGSVSASVKIKLVGWIPDDRWSFDTFDVTLLDAAGTELETQTVTFTTPLSEESPSRTITWSSRRTTRIARGNYTLRVHQSLQVPYHQYPYDRRIEVSQDLPISFF